MPPSCAVTIWADLQSMHGFGCYSNIAQRVLAIGARDSIAAKVANAKCQRIHACTRSIHGSVCENAPLLDLSPIATDV